MQVEQSHCESFGFIGIFFLFFLNQTNQTGWHWDCLERLGVIQLFFNLISKQLVVVLSLELDPFLLLENGRLFEVLREVAFRYVDCRFGGCLEQITKFFLSDPVFDLVG